LDEPGPGQRYALEARKHTATIRRRRPGVTIELHWCPAHPHKGVPGNEKADGWAEMAADEPDAHGVERLRPSR
jgi:ribonuclease HI